ncbi:MAG: FAD-binding oxidoreductase [Gammaproteobacteria bacterium]
MSSILPKGVTEENFSQAMKAFRDIVGPNWASDSKADRESYNDAYNPGEPLEFVAGGFVAPTSVEEVQAIVKVANKTGVPVWPMSTGKNLAYGGAAPLVPGTVVLDLKRMNKILEVNEDLAYATVEPGVSFFELYRYFQDNGHKVWMSVPGPGWGSIIGNGVERGVGYGYFDDQFANSAGMEIVLPNGELLRAGMGAMRNGNSWPLLSAGFGPLVEGLFTQSNYGVVTKMSRFLYPEPETYMSCELHCANDSGLEGLIDTLRPFKLDETIRNPVVVSNLELIASFMSVRSQWYAGDGPMPDAILPTIQEKLNLGRWNCSFALFGDDVVVKHSWEKIKQAAAKIPNVGFVERTYHPGDEILHPRDQSQAGIPSLNEFGVCNWMGAGGHIDFSPVGPMTGKHARELNELVRKRVHEFGFDHLCGFYCQPRAFRSINLLVFRQGDTEHMQKVRALFSVLITEAAAKGYGEYRTHLAYMDAVADSYDFNNHVMRRFQQQLKDNIDPKGIIAPGKSGIWPKQYRDDNS